MRQRNKNEPDHRTNRAIRAPRVRVIDKDGNQLGVMTSFDALKAAQAANLDLVEISPNAHPPVCKIVDYGKFRYEQAKREKEQKKTQHQVKIKEVKIKPNIEDHDLQVKVKRARDFLTKGDKVRLTCQFRGRQMAHPDVGKRVMEKFIEAISDLGTRDAPLKMMGRMLSTIISPSHKKK